MQTVESRSSELDQDVIKIFKFSYNMQKIFGGRRIVIKDKSIYPIGLAQRMYTLLCGIVSTISIIYFQVYYYQKFFEINFVVYFSCAFGTLIQYFCIVINLIHISFYRNESNVQLYWMIQKIERVLHMAKSNKMIVSPLRMNLILASINLVPFIIGYGIYVCDGTDIPVLASLLGVGLISLYLESVLILTFLYYFTLRTAFFNHTLQQNICKDSSVVGISRFILVKHVLKIAKKEISPSLIEPKEYLENFELILVTYKLFTELFSLPVCIF